MHCSRVTVHNAMPFKMVHIFLTAHFPRRLETIVKAHFQDFQDGADSKNRAKEKRWKNRHKKAERSQEERRWTWNGKLIVLWYLFWSFCGLSCVKKPFNLALKFTHVLLCLWIFVLFVQTFSSCLLWFAVIYRVKKINSYKRNWIC